MAKERGSRVHRTIIGSLYGWRMFSAFTFPRSRLSGTPGMTVNTRRPILLIQSGKDAYPAHQSAGVDRRTTLTYSIFARNKPHASVLTLSGFDGYGLPPAFVGRYELRV